MKTIRGNIYSKEPFEDYERSITIIVKVHGSIDTTVIHIYTTCTDRDEVELMIEDNLSNKVRDFKFTNWNTFEDNERQSKLIEETLQYL